MRTTAAMWMLFLWMFLFPVVMGCEDGSGSDDVDAADNIDTGSAANLDSGDTDDLQNSTDTGTLEGTDGGESDGGDFTPVAFVPDEACRMDELREGTIHGAFCAANEAYCNGSCFSTAGATDAGCELLTINVPNSEGMALDDTHLYFTSYNSVFRTHLSGYQTECVVGGLYFPDGVMRHNDMVYVGINDMFGITGIVRVGADGDDPMLIAENAYGGKNFQVADNTLFFTGMSNMDANLYAAPLAGGTTTEVFTEVMGTDGYAVMDGEVYVIGSNIMRASVDAFDNWEEVVYVSSGSDLFEAEGTLYWLADRHGDLNDPELYAYNVGDTEPIEIQELERAQYLANNDTHLFFMNYAEDDNGTEHIYAVPLGGGTVEVVGTFEYQSVSDALATNSELYVHTGANQTTGGIFRLALN